MSEPEDGAEVMDLDDKIKALRDAGFDLGYTRREYVWPQGADRGHVRSTDIRWESGPMAYWRGPVTSEPDDGAEPYVSFGDAAAGEDAYGQTSTVDRSNYRSIKRDFPDFPWVDTAYSNRHDLGAFVADLTPELIGMLCGLRTDYPLYDEEDHSALEMDEQCDSWDDWLRREIRDHLSPEALDVYDFVDVHGAPWDLDDVWWDMVREDGLGGCLPDHDGLDVLWGDLDDAGRAYGKALIAFGASIHTGHSGPDQLTITEV
jgi:hypothetical protein